MNSNANNTSSAAKLGALLVFLAGATWGCVGLFIRPLTAMGYSNFQLAWVRALIAAIIFFVFIMLRKPDALHIKPRDMWCFLGTGLISVVFFCICYYTTISLTSLSVAAVFMYTSPAFVLILSHFFFGDSVTPLKIGAVVLVIVGCIFVSGLVAGAPQMPLLGFLTGIGAGIGYALYSIFSRFAIQRGYESITITFWTFFIAAIGATFIGSPGAALAHMASAPESIPWLVGLAVCNAVIPYALFTTGLKYVENSRAAVIVSVEVVVASLVGTFVFGEPFMWFNGVGMVLVLIAVALLARE